jgi:hypothetical protein
MHADSNTDCMANRTCSCLFISMTGDFSTYRKPENFIQYSLRRPARHHFIAAYKAGFLSARRSIDGCPGNIVRCFRSCNINIIKRDYNER